MIVADFKINSGRAGGSNPPNPASGRPSPPGRNPAPVWRSVALAVAGFLLAASGLSAQNRIQFHNQDLFLNGINLAWQYFADDIGPDPSTPDLVHFDDVYDQLQANGGNAMRFWLHTTGAYTPAWSGSLVTGPGEDTITDLQNILDLAEQYDVGLVLCLWSFDMLRISNGTNITGRSMNILTNAVYRQAYINNALIPMVQALKGHPAIVAWEIFNEPEGMSDEFGWTGIDQVPMADIQAFINQCAGAIHRTDPKAKVTNGSWSFISATDVGSGNYNYYTDARLLAAGGDLDGYLDFYTVHYYDWMGTALSPFSYPCAYWGLDKPLVIAEFLPPPACANCGSTPYETLYQGGYAGALTWSWTDSDHSAMLAQTAAMLSAHPADVLVKPSLAISLATTNTVVVFWPSPSTGWNLLQNTNLMTTNWMTPPESLNDDGAHMYIVVSPLIDKRFYRLQHP